jgi:hypothetical protein
LRIPGIVRVKHAEILARNQRLQISASANIAASNNPTKRTMILPMFWGGLRMEIGSLLSGRTLLMSGRTLFMQVVPRSAAVWRHLQLVVAWRREVHDHINKVIPGGRRTIPE